MMKLISLIQFLISQGTVPRKTSTIECSYELVPINPSVSIDEFTKVFTLLITRGEDLHGIHDQFSILAGLQYEATVSIHSLLPRTYEYVAEQSAKRVRVRITLIMI